MRSMRGRRQTSSPPPSLTRVLRRRRLRRRRPLPRRLFRRRQRNSYVSKRSRRAKTQIVLRRSQALCGLSVWRQSYGKKLVTHRHHGRRECESLKRSTLRRHAQDSVTTQICLKTVAAYVGKAVTGVMSVRIETHRGVWRAKGKPDGSWLVGWVPTGLDGHQLDHLWMGTMNVFRQTPKHSFSVLRERLCCSLHNFLN